MLYKPNPLAWSIEFEQVARPLSRSASLQFALRDRRCTAQANCN